MERRTFVQLSAWNAIGIPLGSYQTLSGLVAENWQLWLQTVMENCGVKKLENWSQEKLELTTLGNLVLQRKDMEGFISAPAEDYFVYEQAQQQYVFSVFIKRHSVAGLLEVALPFWAKKGDNWEYVLTLSQFQLEAMAYACQANFLQVLPVLRNYSLQHHTNAIPILSGWMEIKTVLTNHNTLTTIIIHQDKKRIWQGDFVSKHPLCSHEIV